MTRLLSVERATVTLGQDDDETIYPVSNFLYHRNVGCVYSRACSLGYRPRADHSAWRKHNRWRHRIVRGESLASRLDSLNASDFSATDYPFHHCHWSRHRGSYRAIRPL